MTLSDLEWQRNIERQKASRRLSATAELVGYGSYCRLHTCHATLRDGVSAAASAKRKSIDEVRTSVVGSTREFLLFIMLDKYVHKRKGDWLGYNDRPSHVIRRNNHRKSQQHLAIGRSITAQEITQEKRHHFPLSLMILRESFNLLNVYTLSFKRTWPPLRYLDPPL